MDTVVKEDNKIVMETGCIPTHELPKSGSGGKSRSRKQTDLMTWSSVSRLGMSDEEQVQRYWVEWMKLTGRW